MKDKMIDAWEEEARRWAEMDEEWEEEYEYDFNTGYNYYVLGNLENGLSYEEATDPCEYCGSCDGFCRLSLDYTGVSWALAKYCAQDFDKWFDKDMFNYNVNFLEIIVKIGWNRKEAKEEFENGSYCLAKYCSEHFDKWWDPERFDWTNNEAVRALVEYCSDHVGKWARDFVDRVSDKELIELLQLQKRTKQKILI